jgi:hypothetical protein
MRLTTNLETNHSTMIAAFRSTKGNDRKISPTAATSKVTRQKNTVPMLPAVSEDADEKPAAKDELQDVVELWRSGVRRTN